MHMIFQPLKTKHRDQSCQISAKPDTIWLMLQNTIIQNLFFKNRAKTLVLTLLVSVSPWDSSSAYTSFQCVCAVFGKAYFIGSS